MKTLATSQSENQFSRLSKIEDGFRCQTELKLALNKHI